ncbi:hypothetical protein TNCV_2017971 [Trichonephila clavipes]|nr:hypothetical protein TNCV_2017971 [Trichonephila clavipes]
MKNISQRRGEWGKTPSSSKVSASRKNLTTFQTSYPAQQSEMPPQMSTLQLDRNYADLSSKLRGSPSPGLSQFRALGAEDLRAPFTLVGRNLLPGNQVKSSLSGPFRTFPGPWVPAPSAQWINRHWEDQRPEMQYRVGKRDLLNVIKEKKTFHGRRWKNLYRTSKCCSRT